MYLKPGFPKMVLTLALGLATCSAGETGHEPGTTESRQRLILSQGYSMLYADASKIDLVDLVLYVKSESKEVSQLVTRISEFGGGMKKSLERIARDYPGVRIDLDPLPEMEKRKRFAIGVDKAIRFAPVAGRDRREYERTMLISLSNGLDHESHLCQVMAREEPDPGLKKFLLESERKYGALRALVVDLLDREYFQNAGNVQEKP